MVTSPTHGVNKTHKEEHVLSLKLWTKSFHHLSTVDCRVPSREATKICPHRPPSQSVFVYIVSHIQEDNYHLRLTHVWSRWVHLRTRSRLPTWSWRGQWYGTVAVSALQELRQLSTNSSWELLTTRTYYMRPCLLIVLSCARCRCGFLVLLWWQAFLVLDVGIMLNCYYCIFLVWYLKSLFIKLSKLEA